jgi:aerobic carbon-monoxide dehydrogenase large subunit
MTSKIVGHSINRLEDVNLLNGTGRFVDDIQLRGMLHATFLRSPHPHAEICSIDKTAALAHKGVHAVYAFADIRPFLSGDRLVVALPSPTFKQQADRPVLAIDEVTYVGEPVAIAIADDRYIAEDASSAIEIDYKVLSSVADCRVALAPSASKVHRRAPHNLVAEFNLKFGNVEEAFSRAAHVFSESLLVQRGGSHSIECRGNVAVYDALQDQLTLWSSTQTPHAAMRLLAEMLSREESRTRVITPDVGGGFGPKLVFYSEDLVTALASILLHRPVKWVEDRREHFLSTTQERDQYWDIEIAVESDGRIRGIRGSMIHDHGAYTARGINVAFEAAQAMPMAYEVRACDLKVKLALTNKVPVTPVRGAGQPQGVFAMERLLDRVARELKLDRAEVRRRNMIGADRIPYIKPFKTRGGVPVVIDTGDPLRSQADALAAAGWNDFAERKASARKVGRFLGIGMANFVEMTGRGPFEPATVKIASSGKVHVMSSAAAMGQSTKTMLAQIVAEQLGGDINNIIVTTGDSATSTLGFGGFGSRQTVTAGSSAHAAAVKVREKAIGIAGHMLEVSPEDLEIAGVEIRLKGAADLKISLGKVAKASLGIAGNYLLGGLPPGMEATEQFEVNEMTYANGTAIAVVEVDPETGGVVVLDFVMAHDCGRVINPMIVEGQIMGGVAHGIGNALFETMIYDVSGTPLTTTLAEYLLPTSSEVPTMRLVHTESPTPLNPIGVKGVGETGVIPVAAAIAGAVEDALSEFNVRIDRTPILPADLVAKIDLGQRAPS